MIPPRLYKRVVRAALAAAALLLLGFAVLTIWVIKAPRTLDALTPYIESALAPPGSDYRVKIGTSLLIWDGWLHPVGIRVKNVDVLDKNGAALAHFPEVGVRMYLLKLVMGRIDLKSIELLNPVVRLVQDEQGNITSFGFSSDETPAPSGPNAPIPAALMLFTSEAGDNPITHLKSFVMKHAALSIIDSHGDAFLSTDNASLEMTRLNGVANGKLRLPLQFDGKHSDIDSMFTIDGNSQTVNSNIVFSQVPSAILHALAPSQQWMNGVRVPLSGQADVRSDFNAVIDTIDFTLQAGAGTIEYPEQLEGPLSLENLSITGIMSDKLNTLTVKKGEIAFKGLALRFSGALHRQADDYALDGEADLDGANIDDIHRYWPLKLAPHSRHWVITRITKGRLTNSHVVAHYKMGDFKLKDLPDEDIDATIGVKGATIEYKPGDPALRDIDGMVRFTGETMDGKVTSAYYLTDTHLTRGVVRFPNFAPADVRLFVDFDMEGPATDVQAFLSLPDLDKAAMLNLTPGVRGKVSGGAKFDFIAFADDPRNDVSATGKINYAVNGNLHGVSQRRFMNKQDVEDANLKVMLDNKGIKADGKARVNGIPMAIDLYSGFGKNNETRYAIKADMPVSRLADFDLPKLDFAKGVLRADATFISSDVEEKSTALVDLTQASINLPQHGYVKPLGERATLKISTSHLPSGNTHIDSFALSGPDYDAAGQAEYDRSMDDFRSFSFNNLHMAGHDLDTLAYERSGNTITLKATGRVFNAAPYVAHNNDDDSKLAFDIDINADRLVLGPEREMNHLRLKADCPADVCRSVTLQAKLKDASPFYYTIAGGELNASCNNAGELARTLGILDTIEGGKLTLKGDYKTGKLSGVFEVREYTIRHAPVLTKIFTIASLTGILDTLSGNGIYFKRLTAPYTYHRGLILLKDAKAHGSALGLTADGTIDTNKNTLDLTGVLVPSYTINSLVGNIPLLGDLLMGGKGKGLLALSYGIHGEMKDPSVRVNPLSVLTPGFLRDVFDIFDKPAPDIDAIEAAQKKAKDSAPASPAMPKTLESPSPPASPAPTPNLPSTDELKR